MTRERVAAVTAIALFVVAAAAGLYMSGSPLEQRVISLDNRRVSDLCSLSNLIEGHWQQHDELPATLADLPGRIKDPETEEPYEYEVVAEKNYRICAVFSRESTEPEFAYVCRMTPAFWQHDAGRQCFEFKLPAEEKQ